MGERRDRTFRIKSENAAQIRKRLVNEFPKFFKECSEQNAHHHLQYSDLGNARFEKEYGLDIGSFVRASFYPRPETPIPRRKLGASKNDDT